MLSTDSYPPYERPPLSKEAISAEEDPLPRYVATAEYLSELDVALEYQVKAERIDLASHSVTLSDGRTLGFDKMLIATGAKARSLRSAGSEPADRVRVLRTFEDAVAVRRLARAGGKILVIGGGFIGLEVAASCRMRGCDVEVVEATDRLMGRIVPGQIAAQVGHRHRREGVAVHLGVSVEGLDQSGDQVEVQLSNGRVLEVDLVVVGIGVDPDTELAADAGLRLENGVAVGQTLETDVEGVFAAGDCCSFPLELYDGKRVRLESWRNAQRQGELAAKNILGANEAFNAVPWFWSDQYDLTIQIAGLPGEGVETVTRHIAEDAQVLFHLASDGRLVAATGLGIGNTVAREIRLAEMLISRRLRLPTVKLADSDTPLKALLAG